MLSTKRHHLAAGTGLLPGRISLAPPARDKYETYRCWNVSNHGKKSNSIPALSIKQHHLAAEFGQLPGRLSLAPPVRGK